MINIKLKCLFKEKEGFRCHKKMNFVQVSCTSCNNVVIRNVSYDYSIMIVTLLELHNSSCFMLKNHFEVLDNFLANRNLKMKKNTFYFTLKYIYIYINETMRHLKFRYILILTNLLRTDNETKSLKTI